LEALKTSIPRALDSLPPKVKVIHLRDPNRRATKSSLPHSIEASSSKGKKGTEHPGGGSGAAASYPSSFAVVVASRSTIVDGAIASGTEQTNMPITTMEQSTKEAQGCSVWEVASRKQEKILGTEQIVVGATKSEDVQGSRTNVDEPGISKEVDAHIKSLEESIRVNS
jgi:hypothetical protein